MSDKANAKVIRKLLMVVGGMFVFGFALVPLYEVICDVTGLNGKTAGRYEADASELADEDRWVKVQFTTTQNAGMPWEFRPVVSSVKVRPGEQKEVLFYAKNVTGRQMVAQAVPSVAPFSVAQYFHKTECFCFQQQALESGESIEMPLKFIVDKDLPKSVNKLTLSYTLFDLPKLARTSQPSTGTPAQTGG